MAKKKQKQTAVNEVPLPKPFQKRLETFFQAVKYDANEHGLALVIVLRPSAIKNSVDANVASWGLTEEMQNKMAKAALKSINGETLYYSFDADVE